MELKTANYLQCVLNIHKQGENLSKETERKYTERKLKFDIGGKSRYFVRPLTDIFCLLIFLLKLIAR